MSSRKDPYLNYNFLVEIDGITRAGFSEVVMPEGAIEVIEYREGHDRGSSARKLPGRLRYSNLILKWGAAESRELFDWWLQAAISGAPVRRNIAVVLLDGSGQPLQRWAIANAWPVKYIPASFNALGDDVAIEQIELALEGFELSD